jgi:hypothetical protein
MQWLEGHTFGGLWLALESVTAEKYAEIWQVKSSGYSN